MKRLEYRIVFEVPDEASQDQLATDIEETLNEAFGGTYMDVYYLPADSHLELVGRW